MAEIKIFRSTTTSLLPIALFFWLTITFPSMGEENTLNLPPAPFKLIAVGAKLTWKKTPDDKTDEMVITAINGFKVDYTWNGKEYAQYPVCLSCAFRGAEIDEKAYAALWPLKVGNKLTINSVAGSRSWTNEITVAGAEKVAVPYGAFDAYRVVSKSKSNDSSWEGVRVYWYAPTLGWTVKAKHSDNEGRDYTYSLIGVTKP